MRAITFALIVGMLLLSVGPSALAQPAGWLAGPPPNSPVHCPNPGEWLLLYWEGADSTAIATAADMCPSADIFWVNRQGRWLGFSKVAGPASDIWNVLRGEAHFLHGQAAVADCTTIQARIRNTPPTGDRILVELQAGTYLCRQPVVIDRDNVTLRGAGPSTILRLADGSNSPVLIIGEDTDPPSRVVSNVEVSDLTIDGNRGTQTSETSPQEPALRNNGISLRRVRKVLVERVTVLHARSGGLVTELGSREVTVRDFAAIDSEFDGLAGYATEESTFSRLTLRNNLYSGLSFDREFNRNLITETVIADSVHPGLFMRHARDNQFRDIRIENSKSDGIYLAENDETRRPARDITFERAVVSGSEGAGLRANDPSVVNIRVVDSEFTGNRGGRISEVQPGQVQCVNTLCDGGAPPLTATIAATPMAAPTQAPTATPTVTPTPTPTPSATPPSEARLEAEAGSGTGQVRQRSLASGQTTVWLQDGECRTLSLTLPGRGRYGITVRYSNDNRNDRSGELVIVRVDDQTTVQFAAQDTGDGGLGWNVFLMSPSMGPVDLVAGTRGIQLCVANGDGYGIEIDAVTLTLVGASS